MIPTYPYSDRDPSASGPKGRGSESVFDLLADRRRRAVLQHLAETDGTATIDELAETIARRESDANRRAISDHGGVRASDLEATRISLHHVHVPRLEAGDAVEFDGREKTVTLTDRGRGLVDRMDAILSDSLDR